MAGNRLKTEAGFTLVELLVVITVLGILLAIAVPRISGVREEAVKREYESLINRISLGMEIVHIEYGHYLSIGHQVGSYTVINSWWQLEGVLEEVGVILGEEPDMLSRFDYDMNHDPNDFRIEIECDYLGKTWEITPEGPDEI